MLYEQALAADGTNVGALANLGIICRRARRYADAKDYLKRALVPTEGARMAPHLRPIENPDWYRIKYQLAALYTNWAADSEPGMNRDKRASAPPTEARTSPKRHSTRSTASRNTGAVGAPRQGVSAEHPSPVPRGNDRTVGADAAGGHRRPAPATTQGMAAVSARPARTSVASLEADAIDPWQLIAYVEMGPHRPPETEFNLACFYTRAGDLTTASKRLLRSVRETQRQERQRLVDVALIDPVLSAAAREAPRAQGQALRDARRAAPFPDADELTRHFDRQDRTISHFQSLG